MTRISNWRQPWESKWTGQSPIQAFLLSALSGRHLAWNLGARSVIPWIMAQSSAHMLPPNPSGLKSSTSWQPFHKDTTCRNFQIDGRCKYCKSFHFDHLCRTCHGKHPWCWKTKCPLKERRSHKTRLHDYMWLVIQARNFSQYSSALLYPLVWL